MRRSEFEILAEEAFGKLPEKFRGLVKNVAVLIEDEPDEDARKENDLGDDETLLGLYRGIPHTERDSGYGVGGTLPDTIHLYQFPIEDEAEDTGKPVADVIYETLWHEIAHHFGMDENEVRNAERRKFGGLV